MADEYIKRKDAYKAIEECWEGSYGEYDETVIIQDTIEDLDLIPSADVAEVRHGKNIGIDYAECDQFVCSECGIELQNWVRVERDEDNSDETHHEYVFNFCPNCGARMDGGT